MSSLVYLHEPKLSDQAEFLTATSASGALHGLWTSPPLTPDQYGAYLERMVPPGNWGLLVCRRDDDLSTDGDGS